MESDSELQSPALDQQTDPWASQRREVIHLEGERPLKSSCTARWYSQGHPKSRIGPKLSPKHHTPSCLFPKSAPARFGCKQREACYNTGVGYGGAVSTRSGGTPVRTVRAET